MTPVRTSHEVEELSTDEVVALWERYIAPLDAPAKERIVDRARVSGWDRTWEMDELAA